MNAGMKYALAFALAAGAGHVGTILAAPFAIMHVVTGKMSQGRTAINRFVFGERTTQKSRNVVRPSPDLAYSSCVYDLADGPLLVTAAPSPDNGYVSISVFDARTDNIAVFDTSQFPQGIRFVLARKGQVAPVGYPVVQANYDTGVILDRRLAPTAETFAAVDQARRLDKCEPVGG